MKNLAQFNPSNIKLPTTGQGLVDINNPKLSLGDIISKSLPLVFGAAGIALLIYLIFGGFSLMLAKGDPKAIQSAQGKITNAIVGFIIIIIAFFIVQLLGQLLKIDVTNPIFSKLFSGK